ncbi:transposase [Streptomyces flaveus]|uniref:transposase n=1 Tax=Streptomyces flaveus TaxID=66370 RepID=UPI003D9E3BC0
MGAGSPAAAAAPERRRRYPGRLRGADRAALAGVMYVLRTGVAWRDVPAETVACSAMIRGVWGGAAEAVGSR